MRSCHDAFVDGVFGPQEMQVLVAAFDAAERHLSTVGAATFEGRIDRCDLARRIVVEARAGEMQPALLWRATLARMLVEQVSRAA